MISTSRLLSSAPAVWRTFGLAGVLALCLPRSGRAEDSIAYKYEDYRENGGRIAVRTQGALIEKNLGTEMHVKLEGVLDAIAGATPTGQPAPTGSDQVVLSEMHERRKAWNAEFSRQFPRVNVALGFANSREGDYVSNGWSVNTLTDFNQKNTTLLLGYAGTDDDVTVFFQRGLKLKKRGTDLITGVTQLLDPRTSVTVNLTFGTSSGYLGDPYKLVLKNTEVVPGVFLPLTFAENRPDEREKWIVYTSVNRAYPELHGALDASYRFYHDDFGTTAHTVNVEWFQKLGEHFMLRPGVRLYQQGAADFYHYTLNGTSITPTTRPTGKGPYYSADFRLTEMRTSNVGLKLIWTPRDWLTLDAALEHYVMQGRDGVTPASAYPSATIATFGAKFAF